MVKEKRFRSAGESGVEAMGHINKAGGRSTGGLRTICPGVSEVDVSGPHSYEEKVAY